MSKISENSYISIGVLMALAGSLFWTGALGKQVENNTREIATLKEHREKEQQQYLQIMVGITRIETEILKLKEESQKHKR